MNFTWHVLFFQAWVIVIPKKAGYGYFSPFSNYAACPWVLTQSAVDECVPVGLASLILSLLLTVSVHRWLSSILSGPSSNSQRLLLQTRICVANSYHTVHKYTSTHSEQKHAQSLPVNLLLKSSMYFFFILATIFFFIPEFDFLCVSFPLCLWSVWTAAFEVSELKITIILTQVDLFFWNTNVEEEQPTHLTQRLLFLHLSRCSLHPCPLPTLPRLYPAVTWRAQLHN